LSRGVRRKRSEVEAHTTSAAMPPLDEATFQQLLEAAFVLQQQHATAPAPPTPSDPGHSAPTSLPASSPPPASSSPAPSFSPGHSLDASDVLSLIAETQERLRTQVRDLPSAGNLIAGRLEQVTKAAGVAIAVIHEDHIEFCTATGVLSSLAGSSAPVGASLPELLKANSWSSVESAIRRDAKCPVVFPIFHEGRTIGLLHLSFPETGKLEEHQIRTCQVMAGLMGETISRVSELQWRQSLAAERTTMIEILERLRPQLERMVADSANGAAEKLPSINAAVLPPPALEHPKPTARHELDAPLPGPPRPAGSGSYLCQQCGGPMSEAEAFCHKCGAPQLGLTEPIPPLSKQIPSGPLPPPRDVQSSAPPPPPKAEPRKQSREDVPLPPSLEQALAYLPARDVVDRFRPRVRPVDEDAQIAASSAPENPTDATLRNGSFTFESTENAGDSLGTQTAEPAMAEPAAANASLAPVQISEKLEPEKPKAEITTLISKTPETPTPWVSAARTHQWLNSMQAASSPGRIWLSKHRADVWVAVSVLLLLLALSGWGSRSAIYGAAQTKVVQPSLTLFERFLVALDLAEPPPAQVYSGNPNARVWVDLHSALYYCSGAQLFGKTAEGKFTTQRDAQLDQFEPAGRKYCQ
jgi:hypothetical protein